MDWQNGLAKIGLANNGLVKSGLAIVGLVTNVMLSLKEKNPKRSLNGKLNLTVRRERGVVLQKLYQTETEIETKIRKKRNSDFAFSEMNQEFEISAISAVTCMSMDRSDSKGQN